MSKRRSTRLTIPMAPPKLTNYDEKYIMGLIFKLSDLEKKYFEQEKKLVAATNTAEKVAKENESLIENGKSIIFDRDTAILLAQKWYLLAHSKLNSEDQNREKEIVIEDSEEETVDFNNYMIQSPLPEVLEDKNIPALEICTAKQFSFGECNETETDLSDVPYEDEEIF